ncbi:hypothetical protein FSARC_8963 [Fusarium sarcochroum]|uniref:Cytochrome P450 monooxygenase n=1 Tax=Fusarium sarcochroum TaxID=1208366 RepID=A0A8H4X6P3_9HYPO|nr:hypothetical protein FSARC_8963 [Fusarium sarcochroum]
MAANHPLYFHGSVLESARDLLNVVLSLHLLFFCSSIIVMTLILWTITSYFTSPLRKYPGPFLAISTGDSHLILKKLHKKYGSIVRIGPNLIDVDIPEITKDIFAFKTGWQKTEFYHGSSALVNGEIVYNVFSQTDLALHKKERQPISKFYSNASIERLEPLMNSTIKKLCKQLEKRFIEGDHANKDCDLGRWILYYAWDVVGITTFSRLMGYLENGCDFDGTLLIAEKAIDYFAKIGTMPWLDYVFDKNPICRIGPPGFSTVTNIAIKRLEDRYQGQDGDYHDPKQPDFLDHFIEVKKANYDQTSDTQIVSWLMVNMIAGSDTTAIAIRNVLYFALKHQKVWKRLTKEILGAHFPDRTPPSYKEVKALPYADAVVRESLRILPGVSMSMERYVPKKGFSLPNGDFLPGGTIVGMSPYILGQNKSVYGDDPDKFCPERWLRDEEKRETDEHFEKRLLKMNQADLSFGSGNHACLGKFMGLYQVYKVLATLITLYEIELVDPQKEWKVTNSWFARQEGLEMWSVRLEGATGGRDLATSRDLMGFIYKRNRGLQYILICRNMSDGTEGRSEAAQRDPTQGTHTTPITPVLVVKLDEDLVTTSRLLKKEMVSHDNHGKFEQLAIYLEGSLDIGDNGTSSRH